MLWYCLTKNGAKLSLCTVFWLGRSAFWSISSSFRAARGKGLIGPKLGPRRGHTHITNLAFFAAFQWHIFDPGEDWPRKKAATYGK